MAPAVKFLPSLSAIPEASWEVLAQDEPHAVLQYSFLNLLETSGAVSPETGWQPAHFTLWEGSELQAAAPLYIRSHSWGDFVFDQGFAQAVEEAGLEYYPKLVGTIPLNPVPAWKILSRPGLDRNLLWDVFHRATEEFIQVQNLTGRHLLWTSPEMDLFLSGRPEAGTPWSRQVYRWENRNFRDFADFLGLFDAGQRKNIRKERGKPAAQGLDLQIIPGEEAPAEHYRSMEKFYLRTNRKFGPQAALFLPPGFFEALGKTCGGLVKLCSAFRKGSPAPVGTALILEKGGRAYGRWWGAQEDLDSLHFNLCYYQPLEEAIRRGWSSFDPGMGGSHKSRRGFPSAESRSYHWARDPRIQNLFDSYLPMISRQAREDIREANGSLPFRTIPW